MRWIAVAGLCAALWACAGAATPAAPPVTLRMARTTANEFGAALERVPAVEARIVTDGGSSITSLTDLFNRRVDVTGSVADVAYLAYAGQLEEIPRPFDDLRGMAVIEMNIIHLMVSPGSAARSLADLKGRRISLGAPGSSTALITARMLEAHGIPLNSASAGRVPNAEMLKRIMAGDLDAAFGTFGMGSQSVTAATKAGARIIDIEGPIIEQMREQYPYLKRALIPAGTYPNQASPVHTIGVDNLLACRADLDADVVYRLLDAYFATLPARTPPNFERAPATPIPLHIGAARYYRQRELSR